MCKLLLKHIKTYWNKHCLMKVNGKCQGIPLSQPNSVMQCLSCKCLCIGSPSGHQAQSCSRNVQDSSKSGPRYQQPSDQTNWIKGAINIANKAQEPFWRFVWFPPTELRHYLDVRESVLTGSHQPLVLLTTIVVKSDWIGWTGLIDCFVSLSWG